MFVELWKRVCLRAEAGAGGDTAAGVDVEKWRDHKTCNKDEYLL